MLLLGYTPWDTEREYTVIAIRLISIIQLCRKPHHKKNKKISPKILMGLTWIFPICDDYRCPKILDSFLGLLNGKF